MISEDGTAPMSVALSRADLRCAQLLITENIVEWTADDELVPARTQQSIADNAALWRRA